MAWVLRHRWVNSCYLVEPRVSVSPCHTHASCCTSHQLVWVVLHLISLFRLNSLRLLSARWQNLSQSTLAKPLSRLPRILTATAGLLHSRRRTTASWITSL